MGSTTVSGASDGAPETEARMLPVPTPDIWGTRRGRVAWLLDLAAALLAFFPWMPPPWLIGRRVRERGGLLLALLAGLIAAVTLLAAVPLYSSAAAEKLLHRDLQQRAFKGNLAVAFRYTATQSGTLDSDRHQHLDDLLRAQASGWLGLSSLNVISAGESATEPVQVQRNGRFESIYGTVTNGYIGYRLGFLDHVTITDGKAPENSLNPDGEIEVVISTEAADKLPVKIGDHLLLYDPSVAASEDIPPLRIQIVGVFQPRDPTEQFWYGSPDTYQRRLGMFVDADSFHRNVMAAKQPFGSNLSWYFLFPERDVTSETADSVIGGIEYAAGQIAQVYPNTLVDRSIYAAFESYADLVSRLRLILFVFAAPVVAIVLYYVSLATNLLIDSQGTEIAVLRSRGARDGQILSLVTVDVVVMAIPALAIGLMLGLLLARLVGSTYGFLLFAEGLSGPVRLGRMAVVYGLIGVALALLTVIAAALGASRKGILARGRAISRAQGQPIWQRYFIDVLLLGIAGYGYYRLREIGSLIPAEALSSGDQPFIDPLLLTIPILFLAASGLLTARLLPLIVSVIAWISSILPFFSVTMALRQVARAPGHYTSLALLLVWTIGLGSFSTTTARTLDRRAIDDAYFQVGSDIRFNEQGWFNADLQLVDYVPTELAMKIPGVLGATRMAMVQLRQRQVPPAGPIRVIGVDRETFPGAVWFRRDFSTASLGELMNRLAANPTGILVERSFADAANLSMGAALPLYTEQGNEQIAFVVAGFLEYFPTLYPSDGPFVVVNSPYLEDSLGTVSQQLLVRVDPDTAASTVQAGLQDQGFLIAHTDDARLVIKGRKLDPLRVGTFGLLSVGFLAGLLLIVLGFVTYVIMVFRRRSTEFGLLRVLGLSGRQLGMILVIEHAFIVGAGVGIGSLVGTFAAKLLTPYLLATETGKHAGVPPVLPVQPWDDLIKVWGFLALIVFLAIPILVITLMRRQLAQSLRLGEVVE